VLPDFATKVAALQTGEMDWLEYVTPDLLPLLRKKNIATPIASSRWGSPGFLRPNHLYPPFDRPAVRRALMGAIDQTEFMIAMQGEDTSLWSVPCGFFPSASPIASDAGMSALTGKRDDAAVKKALEGSSRQGRSLAGCKSLYRQLPVFGRLAYPMRGEATNRVLLGRKSPGCPAGVFAAVGTIWGASKLGGRNITNYLQPRNPSPREVVLSGIAAGSRPTFPFGKADDTVEGTGASTRCTAGVGDPASKDRLLEITSGSCRGQQGLVTTCKDSPNEVKSRRRREPNGSGG
jgi:hypothetical protein